MSAPRAAAALLAALIPSACLPGDERPEPARIELSAEPSVATTQGVVTPDGWTLTFERLLLALGDGRLDGDGCNPYTESHYERLFDFTVARRERVALLYGLGRCALRYRTRSPSDETVLGAGAREEDRLAMREVGSDAHVEEERIALVARGSARRGDVTKRFAWSFRHSYEVKRCVDEEGGGIVSSLRLDSGEELGVSIEVRGEELFRLGPADEAPFHFDAFAAADADADGWITLAELDATDAPMWGLGGLVGGAGGGSGAGGGAGAGGAPGLGSGTPLRLGEVVYELLLPRVTRLGGSTTCYYQAWEPHR